MVTIYRSSDASAPVLAGAPGSLTALLNACLVVGYGSKAAAGWARTYNDAPNDTSVFRAASGSRFHLRVDDGGPGAGTFKEARAVGYETMTDVDTGVAPFPTVAQMADGVFIRKSATADATARSWVLAASGKMFHLFVYTTDTAAAFAFSFGDCYSYKPADAYACRIVGRTVENSASGGVESFSTLATAYSGTTVGTYLARSYTGIGGSALAGQHADYWRGVQPVIGRGAAAAYPDPAHGGLNMTPVYIHEASVTRGTVPGIWNPLADNSFGNGDTISGVGGLSGRTFEIIPIGALTAGQVMLETSDTWTEN